MTIDLTSLPRPAIIEEPAHSAILTRQNALFRQQWEAVIANHPDEDLPSYDTYTVEHDPHNISNQAESFRETLLRAGINNAGLARFLAFATGANLDHLALFYDVYRLPGETDDRLKVRVILTIQGRSTGGPEERYQAIAMAADIRVQSAKVYRLGRSPVIYVAIYSTEANGAASAGLIAKVSAALTHKSVQLVNDTIVVASAVRRVVDLVADIRLLEGSDVGTIDRAAAALRAAWAIEQALGRDLTEAWWTARLMIQGVYRVAPVTAGDVVAAPTEAIAIGTITLNEVEGRAF